MVSACYLATPAAAELEDCWVSEWCLLATPTAAELEDCWIREWCLLATPTAAELEDWRIFCDGDGQKGKRDITRKYKIVLLMLQFSNFE